MEKFVFRGRQHPNSLNYAYGYLKIGAFNYYIQDIDTARKVKVFKESVDRYTGRIDRYGSKIYEGDIVKAEEKFALVKYSDEHAKFKLFFWMEDKNKDFEDFGVGSISKVGDEVNNARWLEFDGKILNGFDETFDFLEDQKRSLVDQTRLLVITKGSLEHPSIKTRDVLIYDAGKSKKLAYTTPDVFEVLEKRNLVSKATVDKKTESVHIYVGTLVKKRKNKTNKEENSG